MSVYEKKVPAWKVEAVDDLAKIIKDSKMVGLINGLVLSTSQV